MNMDIACFINKKKHENISCVCFTIQQSRDRLALLTDGTLRHYISNPDDDDTDAFVSDDDKDSTTMLYDYAQGKYCMDKVCMFDLFFDVI